MRASRVWEVVFVQCARSTSVMSIPRIFVSSFIIGGSGEVGRWFGIALAVDKLFFGSIPMSWIGRWEHLPEKPHGELCHSGTESSQSLKPMFRICHWWGCSMVPWCWWCSVGLEWPHRFESVGSLLLDLVILGSKPLLYMEYMFDNFELHLKY